MNEFGAACAVQVDPLTFRVLMCAIDISSRSGGCFDITVAPQLVERGLLPLPNSREAPDPEATWQDIEMLDDHCVRFRRPLWLDLGGIAKGFAVDHALEMMALPPESSVCINAGGDLRVAGPGVAQVRLCNGSTGTVPVMRLQEASLASSSGRDLGGARRESRRGPHIHGVRRIPMGRHAFVSVVARECMLADALTKVVMALEEQSEPILVEYGATAYHETNARGWRTLGVGA
jgi:thiamine biosynthesis lipoprotein